MRKVLSSIGIGSATVDTILADDRLHPGETVDLTVEIEGGSTEQEIEGLYFVLETEYLTEDGSHATAEIETAGAKEAFTIEPDEHRSIPASMTLPRVTPLTRGAVSVSLVTGLKIDWAKDPQDRDYIDVYGTAPMAAVLTAVERLGFAFSESDCKQASVYSPAPFVQEFEFEPINSEWRRKIDELEVIFAPLADELEVRVEVDRRETTYTDLTGGDESREWIGVDHADEGRLRRDLRSLIDQHF
jgi:sporulation-control protein